MAEPAWISIREVNGAYQLWADGRALAGRRASWRAAAADALHLGLGRITKHGHLRVLIGDNDVIRKRSDSYGD